MIFFLQRLNIGLSYDDITVIEMDKSLLMLEILIVEHNIEVRLLTRDSLATRMGFHLRCWTIFLRLEE